MGAAVRSMSIIQRRNASQAGELNPQRSWRFVIACSRPNKGDGRQGFALARELMRRGHSVVLLVTKPYDKATNEVPEPTVLTWPSPRPTRLRDAFFLHRLLRHVRPDCVVANFGAVNLMMTVGWVRRVTMRVSWYRTVSMAIELDSPRPRWHVALLRARKRQVYALATHVVANSRAARRDICDVYGVSRTKVRVFPNFLEDPFLANGSPSEPPALNRIVCVGRLAKTKGQDVLIRAVSLLVPQFPELTVEFIGGGPLRAENERLARELGVADHCLFRGGLPHPMVSCRVAAASFAVVPSRAEAFGLVTAEALALGRPVVASRVGGIAEIVRDGTDGLLVAPDDPIALAEAIRTLLQDKARRDSMGIAARARFLSEFEQSIQTRRQADWFESQLAARAAAAHVATKESGSTEVAHERA
jgi:glycosyltransferase involved in cell wall biosynthesis